MADDNTNTTRIQSMLDDLAKQRQQRSGGAPAPSGAPPQPPPNLPTQQSTVPSRPAQQPKPAPQPVASAPKTPPTPPHVPAPSPPKQPKAPEPPSVAPPARTAAPPPPPTVPVTPPVAKAPEPPAPSAPKMPEKHPQTAVPTSGGTAKPPHEVTQESITTEIRTMEADVSRLSTGQAPAAQPISPQNRPQTATPVPPTMSAPAQADTPRPSGPVPADIAIPEPQGSPLPRKIIFIVLTLIVLLVVGYGIVSLLSGGSPEPTPTATPEPSPLVTLKPSVVSLASIFGQRSGTLALSDIPVTSTSVEDFRNKIIALVPSPRTGRNVTISDASQPGLILDRFSTYWASSSSADRPSVTALGDDYAFVIFGQTEIFDTTGALIEGASTEPRIVAVFELTDASEMSQTFELWEGNGQIGEDLQYAFDYRPADALVTTFGDGAYRQVPLRYQNFPYADRSVDWGIIPASNGLNYLVLANSRQAFFYAYDQLLK